LTKQELKYLVDIQLVIDELKTFFPDEKKFEDFNNKIVIKRAVERIYEIIGEAIRNYKNLNPPFEITNAKEIIGLRNIIAHAYDSVDYPKLWGILINKIPQLKLEVDQLVEKYDIHLGYKKQ
jgi:uncharacterized protein with HEPN domain